MKIYLFRSIPKTISLLIFSILLTSFKVNILLAEESILKEMQIESSTKLDIENSALPSNPFEIVEMLRRANSLNDATKPSDAIDDALKSFYIIEEKENL